MSRISILKSNVKVDQQFEGILPKGPYLPYISMAGRALLAGCHRIILFTFAHFILKYKKLCRGKTFHTVNKFKQVFEFFKKDALIYSSLIRSYCSDDKLSGRFTLFQVRMFSYKTLIDYSRISCITWRNLLTRNFFYNYLPNIVKGFKLNSSCSYSAALCKMPTTTWCGTT